MNQYCFMDKNVYENKEKMVEKFFFVPKAKFIGLCFHFAW